MRRHIPSDRFTQCITMILKALNCKDRPKKSHKTGSDNSDKKYLFLPYPETHDEREKHNNPNTRIRPDITHYHTREQAEDKEHGESVHSLKGEQTRWL